MRGDEYIKLPRENPSTTTGSIPKVEPPLKTPRPSQLHCSETLSSLRFAARAKKIENMATWILFCLQNMLFFFGLGGGSIKIWVGRVFVCVVFFGSHFGVWTFGV